MSKSEESEKKWMAQMDEICLNLNVDPVTAKKSKDTFLEIHKNYTLDVSNKQNFHMKVITHVLVSKYISLFVI